MLNFNYVSIMFIEPSTLEVLDFLKAGFLPSTADRCVYPEDNPDLSYFTDFIDDKDLLDTMIENNSSSKQAYWHMNELASALSADFDACSDSCVRMSCMLLKATGSINFGISMLVNGYYVSYDLYFDFPCTK